MHNYTKLGVWLKAHNFVLKIYRITKAFPKEELYALVSQIRRAAYSMPSNIAEGAGRNTSKDFIRFLQIALGSANEVNYFLLLSKDLEYISAGNYEEMKIEIDEIGKMLSGLIKYEQSKI